MRATFTDEQVALREVAADLAADAAIAACGSPVATHHAAHSASERESSTSVYASASGWETAW